MRARARNDVQTAVRQAIYQAVLSALRGDISDPTERPNPALVRSWPMSEDKMMTNEEMAAELRKAGWQIQEPITQANCPHPTMSGSGGIGCDGSGYSESYCHRCGYRSREEWGPSPNAKLPLIQN
jgi:hypothetical protein